MKVTFNPQNQTPPRSNPQFYAVEGGGEILMREGVNEVDDAKALKLQSMPNIQPHIEAEILVFPVVEPEVKPTSLPFNSLDFTIAELRQKDGPLSKVTDIAVLKKNMELDERRGADRLIQNRIEDLEREE